MPSNVPVRENQDISSRRPTSESSAPAPGGIPFHSLLPTSDPAATACAAIQRSAKPCSCCHMSDLRPFQLILAESCRITSHSSVLRGTADEDQACPHHLAFFCLAFLVRAAFSPFAATSSSSLVPSVIARTNFLVWDQRAWAARRADSLRCSGVIFLARVLPPSLPNFLKYSVISFLVTSAR
jgi:hypothetical protein